MPKQKTHKGAKKRFRVTATGKLKHSPPGKRHLNGHKRGVRKQRLRHAKTMNDKAAKKVVQAILNGI
jgi:large subunit ribosomal protein L35